MMNMILPPAKKQAIYDPYVEMLQDLRQSQNLTQSFLAESVGLSAKYVTLIEGRKRVPALDSLLSLMAEVGLQRSTAERLVGEILDQFTWKG